MSGGINTTASTRPLHHQGFDKLVNLHSNEYPDFSAAIIGKTIPINQLYYHMLGKTMIGQMQPIRESQGVPYDTISVPQEKKWYLKIWAIGWVYSMYAQSTDVSGAYKDFAKMAARSEYYAKQNDTASLIVNMINTASDYLGMSGKPLVATDHPIEGGGTTSNRSTAALLGYYMLRDMIKVGRDMLTWKREVYTYRGRWRCIVAPYQEDVAMKLKMNEYVLGTADRDKAWATTTISDYSVNPFLSSVPGYTLLVADSPNENPICRFENKTSILLEKQDEDNLNFKKVASKVWSHGWENNYGIIGCPGVVT